MRSIVLGALTASLLVISPGAQLPPQASSQSPMATWLRNAYRGNRDYVARAAEKMPEDLYSMRPGTQTEVRTFGQLIGHLANFNYLWCSQARGEKNPNEGNDFEKATTKAALVKGINDALAYCDQTYASLTDSSGAETVQITQENGRQAQMLRMSLLVLNYGHNNEHYGNIVTYMRIKSLVPPSSEPR